MCVFYPPCARFYYFKCISNNQFYSLSEFHGMTDNSLFLHSWYQDILQSLQVLLINFIQKLFAFWITADLFMLKSIFKHFTYNHVLEVDHEYILFLAYDWSRYIGTWAEKLFYCIKISFASHWWQCHCTLMFSSS